MKNQIFEREHQINYYECDANKQLTISMLVNVMMQVSGEQSHELGVGDEELAKKGLAWIVLQYAVDIKHIPTAHQKIKITTQALSYNKLFCYREFHVYDETGTLCVTAKSTFALLNFEKRKMVRIQEETVAPFQAPFSKKLVRTPKPEKVVEEQFTENEYRVRYLDIDTNLHVNNSKYLDWAIDTLDYDFLTTHKLTHLNIKFEKEVYYGNQINSQMSLFENEEGEIISAHRIMTGDVVNSEASMTWKKNGEESNR
ncbi:acyl-[acyl-carrier-protein] thioesterase [Carnobacterium funditum]|uniref:acyl-[acyl-carrier-protein] thioesterase n=1 Tax=Carnobacterium funditum TaxID=2752 RepID=UPI000691884C|nr:acyl-ACP thioesterase domain-containing protein [Carnobacterium funditum]